MKRRLPMHRLVRTGWAWLASAAVACAGTVASAPAEADPDRDLQAVVRRVVAAMAPSVVTVETIGRGEPGRMSTIDAPTSRPAGERRPARTPAPPANIGLPLMDGPTTGLVYSADGLILTSSLSFIGDPAVITVRLADGSRHTAKLLARDELRRLAMLRIPAKGLPVPAWAEERGVRVGQWAVALGRGLGGDELAVSLGIVSGLKRMSDNAIQTDARLSPANYGGPLVNLQGRVLGLIVPMSYSPGDLAGMEFYDSGIGFAVPAWRAEPAALRLAEGRDIRRGMLGVRLDRTAMGGVRVLAVAEPSPARTADIRSGDEIIAIDDEPVATYPDIQRRLAFRADGEAIAITLRRDGKVVYSDAVLATAESLGAFSREVTDPAGRKPSKEEKDRPR